MATMTMERPLRNIQDLFVELANGIMPAEKKKPQSFFDWLPENYFIDDKPFSFEKRYPLEQIAKDMSKHIVLMKSAQCGISELLVGYSFYFPVEYGENVFYAMPAKEQIRDFVQGRVDPRIDDSLPLQSIIMKTDNTGLKQVGNNFIYYRGSQNTRQIKTVDAGCLIRDEKDEMIQENNSLMEKRLGDSENKIIKDASTPTYYEMGIHYDFLMSDQHEYHMTCDKCGEEQIPDWALNISPKPTRDKSVAIPDKVELICKSCQTALNRSQQGFWKPLNINARIRGYHISKLIFEQTDLKELWTEYQVTRNLKDFYNSNLGVPYASEGGKLDDQALNSCREEYKIDRPTRCTMGVDVGEMLNVRVSMKDGQKKKAVWIGIVKTFEELGVMMKQFDVKRCVIDGLPETRESTRFAFKFPGRVYLAYYQLSDHNRTFEYKEFDNKRPTEPSKVLINRTRAMDETGSRFITRDNIIPMNANLIPNYYDQMKAPQKVKIEDENGNMEYKYVEGNRADHYYHAEVYDDIAGQGMKNFDVLVY